MRLYQIVFSVPDNFIPEDAEITVKAEGSVSLIQEGFIGDKFEEDSE